MRVAEGSGAVDDRLDVRGAEDQGHAHRFCVFLYISNTGVYSFTNVLFINFFVADEIL